MGSQGARGAASASEEGGSAVCRLSSCFLLRVTTSCVPFGFNVTCCISLWPETLYSTLSYLNLEEEIK